MKRKVSKTKESVMTEVLKKGKQKNGSLPNKEWVPTQKEWVGTLKEWVPTQSLRLLQRKGTYPFKLGYRPYDL
jgi:hypothetical protein